MRYLRMCVLALIVPLGGCLDEVGRPLNPAPTASEDPFCKQYIPANGEVVNYGCAAGRSLAHPRYHHHHHRRPVGQREQ